MLALMVMLAVQVASPSIAASTNRPMPAWLAGAWANQDGDRWSDEYWTPPRAGLMIGAARVGEGETLIIWESTRIERKADGTLSFFAQPRGVPAVEFPQVAAAADMIEFASPAHDYPQRVRYWRQGTLLKARISLMDGSKPQDWSYAPLGR